MFATLVTSRSLGSAACGAAGVAFALACLGCGGARALPDHVDDQSGVPARLVLDAPEGCGTRAALERAVDERVGRQAFVDEADVHVEVLVRAGVVGWHAEVITRGPRGQTLGRRDLEEPSPDCAAMWDALGFVLALVVDAPTLRRASEPAPPSEVALGLHGRGAVGRSPFWSGGIGAFVVFEVPDFVPLRLEATGFLPGRDERAARVFEAWAIDASLSVCPRIEEDVLRLDLCAGVHGGVVIARGLSFDVDQDTVSGTLDLALWARPGVRIDAMVLSLGVGVGVALLRPGLVFVGGAGDLVPLYEPSLVWGQVEASLAVAFE